jgi:hypothetical protein
MTLFHWHRDQNRFPLSRLIDRLCAAFRMIHEAIVAAKLRRLRSELTFHAGTHENWPPQTDADAAKVPRHPLILGDKWDF